MEVYVRIGTPVLVIIAVLALFARGHGGASPAVFITVAALAFLFGVAVCAAVMVLVLRRRLAQAAVRPPVQALPASAYRVNPDAAPAPHQQPRAIAAPAPQVVINLGDTLAGLLREQAALVIPPADQENRHG